MTMAPRSQKPERGIWKKKANINDPDVKVLDFSYTSDILAQLVVDALASPALKAKLLNHDNQAAVQAELASRGVILDHTDVLSETEYNTGWQQNDEDEVVVVLPDDGRKIAASGTFTL